MTDMLITYHKGKNLLLIQQNTSDNDITIKRDLQRGMNHLVRYINTPKYVIRNPYYRPSNYNLPLGQFSHYLKYMSLYIQRRQHNSSLIPDQKYNN